MRGAIVTIAGLLYAAFSFGQADRPGIPHVEKPFVLGVVTEIPSAILSETRTLNIYLPEGYHDDDTTGYPVIYLLDGSADEDFIHIVGLVQFNSFEWVNVVPKSIVVGIATVDRRRDFTFPTTVESERTAYPTAGHADNFIAFIETELQPFIARNYRTAAMKTIVGQSMGGLLASQILLERPSLFDKYVIVSPSLWWDNGSLLERPIAAIEKADVYIGVGKEGLAPAVIPRVMEVDANRLADKISKAGFKDVKVHFDYLPSENHATIMHEAVSRSFRVLYRTLCD